MACPSVLSMTHSNRLLLIALRFTRPSQPLGRFFFVLQADVIRRPIILHPFPPDSIRPVHRSLCWMLSNNSVLCARVSRTRFSFPLPSSLPSKYQYLVSHYLDISYLIISLSRYLVISEFSLSCARHLRWRVFAALPF